MHTTTQKGGTAKPVKNREKLNCKQIKAIKIWREKVENDDEINFGSILRESGYSPNTAKTPQKVFGKLAMKREMEQRSLSPDGIIRTLEDLMNATTIKKYEYPLCIPKEDIVSHIEVYLDSIFLSSKEDTEKMICEYYFIVPDMNMRAYALKIGYKIFRPRYINMELSKPIIDREKLRKLRELPFCSNGLLRISQASTLSGKK